MSVIYARLAKFGSITLIVLFALSAIIFVFTKDLPNSVPRIAAMILGIVFLPSIAILRVMLNSPLDKELSQYDFKTNQRLRNLVQPLLKDIDKNTEIRVGTYQSNCPNAFAITSLSGKHAVIAFSTALINQNPSDEQLYAIAAHEVAHVKHNDAQNKIWILVFHKALETIPHCFSLMAKKFIQRNKGKIALCVALFSLMLLLQAGSLWTRLYEIAKVFKPVWFLLLFPASILGSWALRQVLNQAFFAYSRSREYAADAGGAKMASPEAMINALSLFPDDEMNATSLFDSHPPMSERKKRLQSLSSSVPTQTNHTNDSL